jgi:hypothetical protein
VRLAEARLGAVHRDQLLALGLSADAVDRRVERGTLRIVHPMVYAVGHLGFRGRVTAALLWAGDDAIVSHATAAALWELAPRHDGDVHLTSPRTTKAPDGVVAHWARTMPRHTRRQGLPVTTVARTILDLAATQPVARTRRILQEALYQKRTSVPQLERELAASPGRRSHAVLRRLLPAAAPAHSALEDRFLPLIAEAGLPRPDTNVRIAGFEVDAVWRRRRVAVELDTFHSHGDHLSFEQDRRKAATLRRAGYEVLRFSDEQVDRESHAVVATVAAALYSAASSHQ